MVCVCGGLVVAVGRVSVKAVDGCGSSSVAVRKMSEAVVAVCGWFSCCC